MDFNAKGWGNTRFKAGEIESQGVGVDGPQPHEVAGRDQHS